jgi:hypothetical protein
MGEQTPRQPSGGVAGYVAGAGLWSKPVVAGTFDTYRRMRANPTIALARIAATAPIRSAAWSIQASDGVPRHCVRFVRQQIGLLWPILINDLLYALDYGFQAFEKVFEIRGGQAVYRKLKPLAPEITEILVDERSGSFAGLRQGQVVLPVDKVFLFAYDAEAGNFYGRSRHENIREHAWQPWMELARKRNQYFGKVAGVIPVVEYPEGESLDASGASRSNFDLARSVLQNLGDGKGVAMPNVLARHAGDLVRGGIDAEQLKAWHISFLETAGQHGGEFTETMRHLESLMLRGWLVPERAAAEGQYGTRADAAEHAKLALAAADLLLGEIVRCVNWYLINPLLVLNFGPQAENSVSLARGGLDPGRQAFFRGIIERALTAGPDVGLLLKMLDLEAMLDAVGLPRAARGRH